MTMPIEGTKPDQAPGRRRHLQLLREGEQGAAPLVESGARRALNVLVALVGILVTFPLWIGIAVLVKLT